MNRLEGTNYSCDLIRNATKWIVVAENGENTVTFHFGFNPFEVIGALEMAKSCLMRRPSEPIAESELRPSLRPVE